MPSAQGAKITKSSHFNYQYVLGHKIAFLCVAKGIPLPQITWFKDGVELYAHRYMQVRYSDWLWSLQFDSVTAGAYNSLFSIINEKMAILMKTKYDNYQ